MEKQFSQNLEDAYIAQYFEGRIGKFLDIGAYNAERLSNTRRLFLAGWSGVLVEADPDNYKGIADFYKDEPRIEVLGYAIGVSNEPLTFYKSGGDAVSTSDEAHKTKWEGGGVKFEEITVDQVHVADFMEKYIKDVNFISIDTEATNMQIFNAIPDYVFEQIGAFILEHDQHIFEIETRLQPFGFKTIYTNPENILLVK